VRQALLLLLPRGLTWMAMAAIPGRPPRSAFFPASSTTWPSDFFFLAGAAAGAPLEGARVTDASDKDAKGAAAAPLRPARLRSKMVLHAAVERWAANVQLPAPAAGAPRLNEAAFGPVRWDRRSPSPQWALRENCMAPTACCRSCDGCMVVGLLSGQLYFGTAVQANGSTRW
jgi:hypothetical protein